MNVKKTVKKIVALGLGATMVGASIVGAMAYDLGSFPEPFAKDGVVDTAIVIGAHAQAIDTIAGMDLTGYLQQKSVTKVPIETSDGQVIVTEGDAVSEDVSISNVEGGHSDTVVSEFGVLTDNDLTGLQGEDDVRFEGKDLNIDEKLEFKAVGGKSDAFMLSGLNGNYEDYGSDARLTFPAESINYEYVFNEGGDLGTAPTSDHPLKITFMGQKIEIIGVDGAADKITYRTADSQILKRGSKLSYKGEDFEIVNVFTGKAQIKCGSNTFSLDEGEVTSSDCKNEVELVNAFDDDGADNDYVELRIGESVEETVANGDDFELFGEIEIDDNAVWKWVIDADASDDLNLVGITNAEAIDNVFASDDTPDYIEALKLGDKITLPNDFASIEFASLSPNTLSDYNFKFVSKSVIGVSPTVTNHNALDSKALKITGDDLKIGNSEVDDIYLVMDHDDSDKFKFVGKDGDDWVTADTTAYLADDSDLTVTLTLVNGSDVVKNAKADVEYLKLDIAGKVSGSHEYLYMAIDDTDFDHFGTTEDEDDAQDLRYYKYGETATAIATDTNAKSIQGDDSYDALLQSGIVIKSVESNLDNDKVYLSLPKDEVEAQIVVSLGDSTTMVESSSTSYSEKINPLDANIAVLDSEFTVGSKNAIVIGGPCVNTVAAELMGNPANCAEGIAAGQAVFKYVENNGKANLVVYGYSGENTRAAVAKLISSDNGLSGSEALYDFNAGSFVDSTKIVEETTTEE